MEKKPTRETLVERQKIDELGQVIKSSFRTHNIGLFNQIKYNSNSEHIDHQKYIDALADSQDLVQESCTERTNQTESSSSNKTEVQDAIDTVKAVLAQQGVAMPPDFQPENIEQILQ